MEQEELGNIYETMKPQLLCYCTYRCGDPDVAEDIVQEAMLRLWQHEVQGPPESIRAWLFKTAKRLIMDADKIARNRRRLRALNPTVDAPPELPDEALERKEARARVRAVLRQMPERGRDILLLRYSGFEYREIAAEVDVAPGSVGTLLARAERRFLELMETPQENEES